mmetsp:Transcript_465/g.839  ORF Transcript_465/g.839 Transcript_465/m.839 type:complete len:205 (-) Transcript_465:693-1307(-)
MFSTACSSASLLAGEAARKKRLLNAASSKLFPHMILTTTLAPCQFPLAKSRKLLRSPNLIRLPSRQNKMPIALIWTLPQKPSYAVLWQALLPCTDPTRSTTLNTPPMWLCQLLSYFHGLLLLQMKCAKIKPWATWHLRYTIIHTGLRPIPSHSLPVYYRLLFMTPITLVSPMLNLSRKEAGLLFTTTTSQLLNKTRLIWRGISS